MNLNAYVGRICTDVELKTASSNISVCSFRIAVKRPHAKDTTDFIPCTAFRSTAEFIAKWFGKGQMIGVKGYLTSRNFEDKNGNKRTAYEVIVEEAEFVGSKSENAGNRQEESDNTAQDNPFEEDPYSGYDLAFLGVRT